MGRSHRAAECASKPSPPEPHRALSVSGFRQETISASTPAAITSPAPASTLAGASVTFSWDTGTRVSQYHFVGTAGTGSSNVLLAEHRHGPHLDGEQSADRWQRGVRARVVAAGKRMAVQRLPPAPGSTLAGASVTFNWDTGTGVSHSHLYVGTGGAAAQTSFHRTPAPAVPMW